jgi:hypothetical protein
MTDLVRQAECAPADMVGNRQVIRLDKVLQPLPPNRRRGHFRWPAVD